jgi:hypothetical protein
MGGFRGGRVDTFEAKLEANKKAHKIPDVEEKEVKEVSDKSQFYSLY